MLLLTFLFATFTTISAWTYNLQDAWGEKSPSCNGKQQSPINFITNRATPENARPFNLTGYSSKIKGINLILMNSGHSAKLDFSKMPTNKRPTISDGVLGNATYVLEQIHFHWGGASGRGSEHLIDWKQYDLETHLVHRNAKYKSVDDAIGHEDGLSVLSFLYFSKPSSGNFLKHITNRLPFIKKEGSKTKLRAGSIKLARMFSIDRQSKYFNYIGSLTTPGCDEKVKWIVFPQAQIISSEEVIFSFYIFLNYFCLQCFFVDG